MKAKPQKQITLTEIIRTLDTNPLFDARSELCKSFNAALAISGTVLKVVRVPASNFICKSAKRIH